MFPELPIDPPEDRPLPICMECGEELGANERVYFDRVGRYIGCSCCITFRLAEDYFIEEEY